MILKLSRSLERLERERSHLLKQIEALPTSSHTLRPSPAEWSSLDVLDHVVKVEIAGIESIRDALPACYSVSSQDAVRGWLMCGLMQSPVRVRVPAGASTVVPDQTSDLITILGRWNTARGELEHLLTSFTPDQLCIGLFRHPVSGWMNATRSLAFLAAHLRHHRYQLDRIRKALPMPS